jgi:hypothetical protein
MGLQQLGVLLDVQHGGAVGGEQLGHGRLELVPADGLMPVAPHNRA